MRTVKRWTKVQKERDRLESRGKWCWKKKRKRKGEKSDRWEICQPATSLSNSQQLSQRYFHRVPFSLCLDFRSVSFVLSRIILCHAHSKSLSYTLVRSILPSARPHPVRRSSKDEDALTLLLKPERINFTR